MRKPFRLILSSAALVAACITSGAHAQGRDNPGRALDYIVAVVNSDPITNLDLQRRLERVLRQGQELGGRLPPREQLAREVLESLVLERAQLHLAKELGVRVDESAVDQGEQNVARQNGIDVPELRRRLQREGLSSEQFRSEIRNQLLITRLRDRELDARVRVTDAEIEQFLQEQEQAPAAAPTEINLAQVLVSVPEGATAQQLAERTARMQEVQRRARAGEDFAALARAYSDAPEASAGGELGLRSPDRYPELFLKATAQLPVGGLSEPVRSGAGLHLLKVVDRRDASAITAIPQQHARHILLRINASQTEEQGRERLAAMRRRIVAGEADFAELARASSQDGSAAQGGDLGWSNPGQFVPEFEEVLQSLQPGDISEPFVSRFGVHLVQLLERRQYTLNPREQREVARGLVRERKMEEAYREWLREVRARAYVEMREPPQS